MPSLSIPIVLALPNAHNVSYAAYLATYIDSYAYLNSYAYPSLSIPIVLALPNAHNA